MITPPRATRTAADLAPGDWQPALDHPAWEAVASALLIVADVITDAPRGDPAAVGEVVDLIGCGAEYECDALGLPPAAVPWVRRQAVYRLAVVFGLVTDGPRDPRNEAAAPFITSGPRDHVAHRMRVAAAALPAA